MKAWLSLGRVVFAVEKGAEGWIAPIAHERVDTEGSKDGSRSVKNLLEEHHLVCRGWRSFGLRATRSERVIVQRYAGSVAISIRMGFRTDDR